jgi:hypothetical protein
MLAMPQHREGSIEHTQVVIIGVFRHPNERPGTTIAKARAIRSLARMHATARLAAPDTALRNWREEEPVAIELVRTGTAREIVTALTFQLDRAQHALLGRNKLPEFL